MNKTGLIAKISIKYVLPTCIWKYFWRISQYFAFLGEFRGISRKYPNFAGPRPREISEALRIPRNIFSFFAPHPRLQCLSLGEKGCLANTFDILLWSRLSVCLSSKLKQLVLCQKVEQNCQTLFFIVVQRYIL